MGVIPSESKSASLWHKICAGSKEIGKRSIVTGSGSAVDLAIISGSNNVLLATAIANNIGVPLGRRLIDRSPDGELRVEIQENLRACDVFLVQPTGPPLDASLMELFFLADACRRSGANHITAITPYFGYARQERSFSRSRAVGGPLVADLLRTAGIGRVVAVDLHRIPPENSFGITFEPLHTVELFCKALGPVDPNTVVVAADMGAFRVAEQYGRVLKLPISIVAKVRVSDQEVVARSIIGDVKGRTPLIIDDMIITGGTIEAALKAVVSAGAYPKATVVATHGLFVGSVPERLGALPIIRLLVTDSVQCPAELKLPIKVVSLASLLAQAISRLHAGEPLGDLGPEI
jgi:ribose-phosphate pyrophosphokinase